MIRYKYSLLLIERLRKKGTGAKKKSGSKNRSLSMYREQEKRDRPSKKGTEKKGDRLLFI